MSSSCSLRQTFLTDHYRIWAMAKTDRSKRRRARAQQQRQSRTEQGSSSGRAEQSGEGQQQSSSLSKGCKSTANDVRHSRRRRAVIVCTAHIPKRNRASPGSARNATEHKSAVLLTGIASPATVEIVSGSSTATHVGRRRLLKRSQIRIANRDHLRYLFVDYGRNEPRMLLRFEAAFQGFVGVVPWKKWSRENDGVEQRRGLSQNRLRKIVVGWKGAENDHRRLFFFYRSFLRSPYSRRFQARFVCIGSESAFSG